MFRNQCVANLRPGKNRCDFQAWTRFTRQIFRAMNRHIHISGEKRSLDFCCEQSFSSGAKIDGFCFVAFRVDNFSLDLQFGSQRLNCLLNQTGLGARKFAAARTQNDCLSHGANVAPVWEAGSFPYSCEVRSELSPTGACPPVRDTQLNSCKIFSPKSATCSAMMASAEAICWRRIASDCSATDRNESMS